MKKLFLFVVALCSTMALGAAEQVVYSLIPAKGSNNGYAKDCDIKIGSNPADSITWNLTGNAQMDPWRIGGKSLDKVDRALYSKDPISTNISKIVLEHGTAADITVNSLTLIVSTEADGAGTVVSSLTGTFTANSTTTFTRPEGKDWSNCFYKFVYNVTVSGSSNKFLQFKRGDFYQTIADVNATAISIQEGTDIELELYREAQLHAVLTPADATTAVTWASSDPTAVSVSETGVVKALKENDDAYATITATAGTLKATIDVYMVDPVVITPSAAAAKANTISADNGKYEGGEYVIEGYVVSVSTKYDASAKTISLQLADAKGGEAVIEAYKCNVTDETNIPTPEAKVRVIGYLSKYSGKAQVAAGGTVAVLEKGTGAPVDKGATTVAAFLEAKDTYNIYTLTGVVSNISNTSYGNFDLVDETGSIYIYGLKDADGQNCFTAKGIEEGDTITVKGSYTDYNGKAEVVNAEYISHKKGVKVDPEDKGAISVADFIAAADKVNIYTLTGTVSDIWTDKTTGEYNAYGNFDLTDETGTILVYGLLTADGQAKQFASMGIDEGDIVTIKGVYTIYNGEPQIASATYVSHVDKTPSAIENTTANSEKKVRKVVENGQIYILKDGVKYNIFGTKVSK